MADLSPRTAAVACVHVCRHVTKPGLSATCEQPCRDDHYFEIEAAPTEVLLPTSVRRLSLLPAPSPLYPAPRAHCRAQRALTVAFHHVVALRRPMSLLLPCKPVCSSPKCRMQRVHIVTRSRMTPLSRAHHALQVVNRCVSRRWRSASVAEFQTMLHTLGLFACVASRLVRVLIHTR